MGKVSPSSTLSIENHAKTVVEQHAGRIQSVDMVVCTGTAIYVAIEGGQGARTGAAVGVGVGGGAVVVGTSSALGAAVCTAASSGAIAGAAATGSVAGAGMGAIAGATSAAGVFGSGVGGGGLVATGLASGPIGWLALGATDRHEGNQATYDCWKPVVHDTSEEPSCGMLLKDVFCHPHVANVDITSGNNTMLPHISIVNIWKEQFEIEYLVMRKTGNLVCHAKPVRSD